MEKSDEVSDRQFLLDWEQLSDLSLSPATCLEGVQD
jgi:hypothetical protein